MDGTYIDQVQYRIFKKGRKWMQAETRTGRPARIQIDELSAGFAIGEFYEFPAKVKCFDFVVRSTDKRIRRTDVFVLPADYRPNKQERKSTLRYCIGAVLEGTAAGYVNNAAIRRGVRVGASDFPALYAEFEAAILQAMNGKIAIDAQDAIGALLGAKTDQERDEARRRFHQAVALIEKQAGSLAEWLRAQFNRANHTATYPKFEQLTMFAA